MTIVDCSGRRKGKALSMKRSESRPAVHKTTFTLGEASQLLSCHKETLRRAITEGRLQAAKLGRGYRISRMDLQAFWTAMGGGELFDRDDLGAEEVFVENFPPAVKKPKVPVPEQLKLPT